MLEIPSLFVYNVFCVMSDMSLSKAGSLTSKEDRYMEWKTKDGNNESMQYAFSKRKDRSIKKNFVLLSLCLLFLAKKLKISITFFSASVLFRQPTIPAKWNR